MSMSMSRGRKGQGRAKPKNPPFPVSPSPPPLRSQPWALSAAASVWRSWRSRGSRTAREWRGVEVIVCVRVGGCSGATIVKENPKP